MSANGDIFRQAAELIERGDRYFCCEAIRYSAQSYFGELRAKDFFTALFYKDRDFDDYWWGAPDNRLPRLIALDLAALIADEEVSE